MRLNGMVNASAATAVTGGRPGYGAAVTAEDDVGKHKLLIVSLEGVDGGGRSWPHRDRRSDWSHAFRLSDELLEELIRPTQGPSLRWAERLDIALNNVPRGALASAHHCLERVNETTMSIMTSSLLMHCRKTTKSLRSVLMARQLMST